MLRTKSVEISFETIGFGKWNPYSCRCCVVPLSKGMRRRRTIKRAGKRVVSSTEDSNERFRRVFFLKRDGWSLSRGDDYAKRVARQRVEFTELGEKREKLRHETDRKEGGDYSAHVHLYEKKIYSRRRRENAAEKRLANRNSWLSINRCHSLTSLPARSVGDILMTSRHTSVQNEPARVMILLPRQNTCFELYLDWETNSIERLTGTYFGHPSISKILHNSCYSKSGCLAFVKLETSFQRT